MDQKNSGVVIKIVVLIAFIGMVTVNALANILPINGIGTGEVSDYYQNLFAPAGITFAIWGVIYFLLLGYVIYQLGGLKNNESQLSEISNEKIGIFFIISSLANIAWIFSWHYYIIGLSMILMVIILVSLIIIILEIKKNTNLSIHDKIFIRLPFSVYFGWITVATIANVTALLVSLNWDGFGLSESIWTVIIISIGCIIGGITMLRNKDIAYGLVIIWAYSGILIKHMSLTGFDSQYPEIMTTVVIAIILLIIGEISVIIKSRNVRITKI